MPRRQPELLQALTMATMAFSLSRKALGTTYVTETAAYSSTEVRLRDSYGRFQSLRPARVSWPSSFKGMDKASL